MQIYTNFESNSQRTVKGFAVGSFVVSGIFFNYLIINLVFVYSPLRLHL